MTTAAEIIDQASRELDEHGWCRGTIQDMDGRMCVVGALNEASNALNRQGGLGEATLALMQYVRPLVSHINSDDVHPLVRYNDFVATSVEDIQLMFKTVKESL